MNPPQEPGKRRPLSDEEITRLLREGARQRPPWTWRGVLFWLLLLALPLVLLFWMFRPTPPLPQLLVLTFDQVATPGQEVTLRGQLWPAEDEARDAPLGDRDVAFVINAAPLQPPAWRVETTSSADGSATARWPAPERPRVADFEFRLIGEQWRGKVLDHGRVFLVPAEASLLLVGADRALTDMPPAEWQSRSTVDVPLLPGVAQALKEVENRKYQIVYLALTGKRPLLSRKVRDWVQIRRLPNGPVLGRPSYAEGSNEDQARKEILGDLKKHFHGPLAALSRQPAEAKAFHDLGLRTLLVGKEDKAPPGVTQVESWADVPDRLGPKK
jgi:hypothetical protein